jgi:hypothetical protein
MPVLLHDLHAGRRHGDAILIRLDFFWYSYNHGSYPLLKKESVCGSLKEKATR